MEEKDRRQSELLKLLETEYFSNQFELVSAMRQRGFNITQPSISRDFRELGIAKLGGRYLKQTQFVSPERSMELDEMLVEYEAVGPHLIVIKTTIGAANVVARVIDNFNVDGLAGTVAGDDTIFVATRNSTAQKRVINSLNSLRAN